jgi:DNA-binding ferritin-like protein
MASEAHLPALEHDERDELESALQAALAELVDLSLIGKQLHWNIVRPLEKQLWMLRVSLPTGNA